MIVAQHSPASLQRFAAQRLRLRQLVLRLKQCAHVADRHERMGVIVAQHSAASLQRFAVQRLRLRQLALLLKHHGHVDDIVDRTGVIVAPRSPASLHRLAQQRLRRRELALRMKQQAHVVDRLDRVAIIVAQHSAASRQRLAQQRLRLRQLALIHKQHAHEVEREERASIVITQQALPQIQRRSCMGCGLIRAAQGKQCLRQRIADACFDQWPIFERLAHARRGFFDRFFDGQFSPALHFRIRRADDVACQKCIDRLGLSGRRLRGFLLVPGLGQGGRRAALFGTDGVGGVFETDRQRGRDNRAQ